MADLYLGNLNPKSILSQKTTPAPLRKALHHIFAQCREGLWLVGGTALAGYYAEHRRSDDLDLFAIDPVVFRTAVHAVWSLKNRGAKLANERTSPYYYHTDVVFFRHSFTIDIVLDEHLHRIGRAVKTKDGIWVTDLKTLMAMKVACLVSRCSEKDLFDLDWLLRRVEKWSVDQLVQLGSQFDAGLTVETLLISLQGAVLRREACHFLLSGSSLTVNQAYRKVVTLRKSLIRSLLDYEKKQTLPAEVKALSQAVRDRKRH